MGDYVRREALKRGLKPTRKTLSKLAFKLRMEKGDYAIAELCLPDITSSGKPVVVDGLRSTAELRFFRSNLPSFVLVAIEASECKRYERLAGRRRIDDPETLEELKRRDMEEARLGLTSLLAEADYRIVNEEGLEELKAEVTKLIEKLGRMGLRRGCTG